MKIVSLRSGLNKHLISVALLLLGAGAWATIVYKAWHIPITHDEVATTLHYYNYNFWEIMMYPDPWPNNHILNTLLTKIFIILGGKEQWVVRMPNVLFFGIYLWGIYRLLRLHLKPSDLMMVLGASFFICNCYLLDFFSLSRGYGISMALTTLSASFLISGYVRDHVREIWMAVGLAILASYASFTVLVFWVCVTILAGLYFLLTYRDSKVRALKNLGVLIITSIAYLALIRPPILKMTSSNQFHYWSSKGFYKDTIYSLAEHFRYNAEWPLGLTADTLCLIVIGLIILSLVLIFKKWWTSSSKLDLLRDPLLISLTLLMGTASISILQCAILKTPNLSGRTALFFYPLFYTIILGLLSKWHKASFSYARHVFVALLSIIMISHAVRTFNFRNVREWWYDENTLQVLVELEKSEQQSITINVHWFFHPSFNFYKSTDKANYIDLLPYDKNIDPDSDAEYYYVFASDLPALKLRYEKFKQFGWDRWLMKKRD